MRQFLLLVVVMSLVGSTALAQDPVKVDPKHYKVAFQNDQVRVLKIHYGPKEKSVMHEHPAGVVVFLTESHTKFGLAGGKAEERHGKAGDTMWAAAEKHLPENTGDKPFDAVLVEMKAKPAAKK